MQNTFFQTIAATGILHEKAVSSRSKLYTVLTISLLMAFTILLSGTVLMGQSLRLDESQSIWQSSHSPMRILNIIAQDVHVPLYGLMLHFWMFLFGNSVAGARVFSFIFFLMTIPLIYLLGKKAYNRKVGLFAALLLSISPFMNWYANEIRMYTLFTFLTVLNQYFFISIFRSAKKDMIKWYEHPSFLWAGYAASALLGMYVHYFFGMALLAQGVFFLFYRRQFPTKTFRNLALTAGLILVSFIPWFWYMYSLGLAGNSRPLLPVPTSINLFNTFSQFMFGFQNDHLNSLILSLWPLSVLLVFLAIAKNKRISPESIYFLLAAFVPITLAFVVSIAIRPLFLTRYLIFAVPSLFLFLSWFLSTYPKKLSWGLQGLLVAGMLLTLVNQTYSASTPVRENYRQASDYLTSQVTPQDVVILSAPFTVYPIEYYYSGQAAVHTLPLWNRSAVGPIPPYNPEKMPQEVEQLKQGHERAFLLLSYDQGYEEDVRLYFDQHFHRLEAREFSPGLRLFVYQLGYK